MAKLVTKLSRKSLLLSSLAVVGLIFVIALILTHHSKPITATIPSTDPLSSSSSNSNPTSSAASSGGSNSSTKSTNNSAPASETNLTLDTPHGTFVSNHNPGQNGSDTSEVSTCNTTPGASCYIQFSQGSLKRTLETRTADTNGAVIWNWDIKDADLTSGSWQITAVASLNGQTKSTQDQIPLTIQ